MKDVIKVHYGKCKIQGFWGHMRYIFDYDMCCSDFDLSSFKLSLVSLPAESAERLKCIKSVELPFNTDEWGKHLLF